MDLENTSSMIFELMKSDTVISVSNIAMKNKTGPYKGTYACIRIGEILKAGFTASETTDISVVKLDGGIITPSFDERGYVTECI